LKKLWARLGLNR